MMDAFTEFVGDPDQFVEKHWDRVAMVRHGLDRAVWSRLLSIEEIDRLIASRHADIQILQEGKFLDPSGHRHPVEPSPFLVRTELSDPAAVHRAFRCGKSVVLRGANEWWPPLEDLCERLSEAMHMAVGATIYVGPAQVQSPEHWDEVHVFALQLHGTKRWIVSSGPEGTIGEEPHDARLEAELGPGDVIYVPRRFPHRVWTDDSISVHVTFGVMAPSLQDVIRRVLLTALDQELAQRSVSPWCAGVGTQARWAEDAACSIDALRRASATVTAECLRSAALEVWTPQARTWGGAFVRSWVAGAITEKSLVRRIVGIEVSIVPTGERVHLVLRGRRIDLPGRLSDAVRTLLESSVPVQLSTVGLDAHDAVVLGRRLVVEGLLEPVGPWPL